MKWLIVVFLFLTQKGSADYSPVKCFNPKYGAELTISAGSDSDRYNYFLNGFLISLLDYQGKNKISPTGRYGILFHGRDEAQYRALTPFGDLKIEVNGIMGNGYVEFMTHESQVARFDFGPGECTLSF